MGCTGQLTCRKVRIGKLRGQLVGGPEVPGITRYAYYQVYRDGELIDCLRTLAIVRRMYGNKVTIQPGM